MTQTDRDKKRKYQNKRYAEDPEFRERRKRYCKKYHERNKERENKRRREAYARIRIEAPWLFHWKGANDRCAHPGNASYQYYGAKGIRMLLTKDQVKILWIRDRADQMKRPSIDRVDSKGDYHFGNCRFIELSENVSKANKERRYKNL